ncbi:hypothetical protein EUGRSUZ_F01388 [Eucalyptus grandis]|uniref:Uncharacterized protein n=2 Tax=Eucalyptus grandis TaxID=71139 RepID=A0ACC3KF16_EUCGR|nr:hypothetical protein EUGRSUZ_F01388 [Eucalyptus grandis]
MQSGDLMNVSKILLISLTIGLIYLNRTFYTRQSSGLQTLGLFYLRFEKEKLTYLAQAMIGGTSETPATKARAGGRDPAKTRYPLSST